ncbi:gas vesicle protein [Marinococcus halotolerans]|uniref:gas vesicle protein n=1 Tax=Marinococcus halotolerans TaxID=301092 RepID=UPI0003B6CC43|nr:gas vesicle protein [Marinococcus halotolerans]
MTDKKDKVTYGLMAAGSLIGGAIPMITKGIKKNDSGEESSEEPKEKTEASEEENEGRASSFLNKPLKKAGEAKNSVKQTAEKSKAKIPGMSGSSSENKNEKQAPKKARMVSKNEARPQLKNAGNASGSASKGKPAPSKKKKSKQNGPRLTEVMDSVNAFFENYVADEPKRITSTEEKDGVWHVKIDVLNNDGRKTKVETYEATVDEDLEVTSYKQVK